ncbi:hypothetical protein OG758_12300 [Streptomyces sp. NBC_01474]|uniref:hypothetical protein n=1 Tax=Streptomyces sp. NBC_01474 TaxID=2903880 RepID=UPI002DD88311|nr:hypothetical protein [Streptomyces sp. NBC_01474]WSD94842.1 hypothetical protein OG758_12300 [Streptomyces sp. NBC_01474]
MKPVAAKNREHRTLSSGLFSAGAHPGEIVQYSVYLEYTDDKKTSVPKWITMEADSDGGFQLRSDFENPHHAAQQIRRRSGIE